MPIKTTELGEGTISIGSLHEYELKVKLKENGKNQSYLTGKTFVAKIVAEYVYE